jgi:hypothetical protein
VQLVALGAFLESIGCTLWDFGMVRHSAVFASVVRCAALIGVRGCHGTLVLILGRTLVWLSSVHLVCCARWLCVCVCVCVSACVQGMDYKLALGAKEVRREDFLRLFRAARDDPPLPMPDGECIGATTTLLRPPTPTALAPTTASVVQGDQASAVTAASAASAASGGRRQLAFQ